MIIADGHRGTAPEGLIHPALFYHDEDSSYLADTVPYIHEGLDADEPVLVAVPPDRLELLRAALGADAQRVDFHDMTVRGRNPARIIPTVLSAFVGDHRGAGRVRIIGEPIWAGRTVDEYPACVQHEALINVALGDSPVTILCPYDTTTLAAHVLTEARKTHPVLIEYGDWSRSYSYAEPIGLAQSFNVPLPEATGSTDTLIFRAADGTQGVRGFVAEQARGCGLARTRIGDLCAAVHEVAVNTMIHTAGPGTVSIWSDGDSAPGNEAVVVEVHDSGWIRDPLAGRHPRNPADRRGYGLLLVNALCDLVRVHTDPSEGTTVRMTMLLGG
jgi:anti-sigma regulatory factor (Ser/Thr protein kinase)